MEVWWAENVQKTSRSKWGPKPGLKGGWQLGHAAPCPEIFHSPHCLLNKVPTLELGTGIQGTSKTLTVSDPSLPPFISLSSQQMYMENLLSARPCSRDWECCFEHSNCLLRSNGGRKERQNLPFYITLLGYCWRTINYIHLKRATWLVLTSVYTHKTTKHPP